jgi:hypothetical protein
VPNSFCFICSPDFNILPYDALEINFDFGFSDILGIIIAFCGWMLFGGLIAVVRRDFGQ